MGELRVVEVFSGAPPVLPQVSSIKTAASPIVATLRNEEQDVSSLQHGTRHNIHTSSSLKLASIDLGPHRFAEMELQAGWPGISPAPR